ncbi:MAG: DUF1365 family protein, partial [Gammaproteobacteria bacterium]|nr:DUF1365 family protein [Gammaproteobacteria bacterium]
ITNTPWGERHTYAVPLDDNRTAHDFCKEFHVSPFMPMDLDYGWSFSQPGRFLEVHMENRRRGDKFFTATLAMKRHELSRGTLTRALLRYPFMT